ncbi:hypothetical protein F5Y16DRAFT_347111 [Xylariaceae sp. FL0255]|nr:hypothetical protein F5Y16DRAFT_347111 [Xylariaceae sp. FL0255]
MYLTRLLTLLALVAVSTAWKHLLAYQFPERDCGGKPIGTFDGSGFQQVAMKNETQSVYIEVPNNGLIRWYAFGATLEDKSACYGEPIGRLYTPCANMDNFTDHGVPEIKCISYCSMLLSKTWPTSCTAIGITE